MEQLILEINDVDLEGLPLFYNKIYFNELVPQEEEEKLYLYNKQVQSVIMRHEYPQIDISKNVNFLLF